MSSIRYSIEKELEGKLGRAGVLETPHGVIHTPAFVSVGTKAAVKALIDAKTDKMVGVVNDDIILTDLEAACKRSPKKQRLDKDLYNLTRELAK